MAPQERCVENAPHADRSSNPRVFVESVRRWPSMDSESISDPRRGPGDGVIRSNLHMLKGAPRNRSRQTRVRAAIHLGGIPRELR